MDSVPVAALQLMIRAADLRAICFMLRPFCDRPATRKSSGSNNNNNNKC